MVAAVQDARGDRAVVGHGHLVAVAVALGVEAELASGGGAVAAIFPVVEVCGAACEKNINSPSRMFHKSVA